MTLKKGHNSTKRDNPDFKKIIITYFLMRNPYMKFQNSILINSERTDGRTDKPKAICPYNFSKVGGIKKDGTSSLQPVSD